MNKEIQDKIFEYIADERIRQYEKWGPQYHQDNTWVMILMEEVGEVAKSIVDRVNNADSKAHLADMKKEIVQVAAVAVAWLECLETKK